MKKLILSMLVVASSFAAQINSAKVNEKKGVIEMEVSYGGGCAEHNFSLDVDPACVETYPVKCMATLVDSGVNDACEAFITETVEVSLADAGLTDSYYSGAKLIIKGDEKSSAVVYLPKKSDKPAPAPTPAEPKVVSPIVEDARLNTKEGVIEVDVTYGGGCLEHTFELRMGGCFESMPVGCSAVIVDTTEGFDACEAIITKTVKFSLREYGLNDSYYSGAGISIEGAHDSRASVRLPRQ